MKLTTRQLGMLEELRSGDPIAVSGPRWTTANSLVGRGFAVWTNPERVAAQSTWEGRAAARENRAERDAIDARHLERLAARVEVSVWRPPPRAREWLRLVLANALDEEERLKQRRPMSGDEFRPYAVRSDVLGHVLAAAEVAASHQNHLARELDQAEGVALYERLSRLAWKTKGGEGPEQWQTTTTETETETEDGATTIATTTAAADQSHSPGTCIT